MQSLSRARRNFTLSVVSMAFTAGAIAQSPTENWPTKAVTLIAPFTPGGTTDIVARALANQLQIIWKQPVVVDNRPGANGIIGTEAVARRLGRVR